MQAINDTPINDTAIMHIELMVVVNECIVSVGRRKMTPRAAYVCIHFIVGCLCIQATKFSARIRHTHKNKHQCN